ncbi:MAG: penicillin-binding protein activator [Thiotrichales bacterium]
MKRIQHLLCCTVALLALAACQTTPGTRPSSDLERQAIALEKERDYVRASEAYEAAARQGRPADADLLRAKAAEMAWLGGNAASAERSIRAINEAQLDPATRARTRMISARIARTRQDFAEVIRLLDFPRTQLPASLDKEIVALLTEAQQKRGNLRAQTELMIERYGGSRATNDSDQVWQQLLALSTPDLSKWLGERLNPLTRGWVELTYIVKSTAAAPESRGSALDRWQADFANHPAALGNRIQSLREANVAPVRGQIGKIGVLLPLSGALQGVGIVIREGIESAMDRHPALKATTLRFHDSASGHSIQSVYQQAVNDGAEWILGPLDKAQVDALAAHELRVPVLTLNFGRDGGTINRNLYQFALLPEDEAEQAARLVIASERQRVHMLTPESEWGDRIASAFSAAFRQLGGTLVTTNTYDDSIDDFSIFLRDLGSDPANVTADLAVFMAATPRQARQLKNQLKHYNLGQTPVFATSHLYSGMPQPVEDSYLDGTIFTEIPWLIGQAQAVDPNLRLPTPHDLSPRARQQPRLFAFGFDSILLALQLQPRPPASGDILHYGLSGAIVLNEQQRLHRQVSYAQFRGGTPVAYQGELAIQPKP